MNLASLIKQRCEQALTAAFPNIEHPLPPIEVTPATQAKFGHYQCNSAMKLAKPLNQSPRIIADKLKEHLILQEQFTPTPFFDQIEIAGPGFINITLHRNYLSLLIKNMLKDERLGVAKPAKRLKVIIDFSSPNIAKEMHVGHLRSTIIGDCLARLLSFLGHDVLRLNHIGDWGTQFGMLIAFIKKKIAEGFVYLEQDISLPKLMQWYKESKALFDTDLAFKKQSQLEVVHLQQGDKTAFLLWESICAISRKAYEEIYDLLDIHLIERGESFYNALLPVIVKQLEEKGLIEISDGAKCIYLEGFNNRDGEPLPLILQKSDGGYNYATTDMAALWHRVEHEQGDWLIYVTDSGQSLHFEMLFQAAKKAGIVTTDVTLSHVPFGLVLGPDGKKFKTRSGETERLIDLLTTAIDKAKAILKQRQEILTQEELDLEAKILGINAVKYADLSCHRVNDYSFSYDKMLKFEGNTAAFLLYAYVRIQSIKRKIGLDTNQLDADIRLEDTHELQLGLLVAQFPETIESASRDLLPHRLTEYLFTLAEKFHVFFHHCRVEGVKEQNSRLLLCESVAKVLAQGFSLLGLKPLAKM